MLAQILFHKVLDCIGTKAGKLLNNYHLIRVYATCIAVKDFFQSSMLLGEKECAVELVMSIINITVVLFIFCLPNASIGNLHSKNLLDLLPNNKQSENVL